MRNYKFSGVKWIGDIPESWTACKMLYVLREKITDGPHETPELVAEGIPFISVDSLNSSSSIDFSNVKKYISEELYQEYSKKAVLEPGDILFTKAATIGKTAIVGDEKFMVWSPIAIIKCNDSIYNKYLYYVLNAKELITAISLSGTYNTQVNVGMRALESAQIPLPPIDEQKLIVSELDKKCAQVDELIANVQSQIEKLKEYKLSIISEAVTRGLDTQAPLKESGIEWIGTVNARFAINPIRSIFKIKKDIIGHEPDTVLSITQNGLRIKNISENEGQMANSYANYQIVNIGDFAMNHMDLITGGIGVSEYEGVTSPDYRVFVKRNPEYNSRYFLYLFEMYYKNKIFYAFGQGAANVGRWRLPAQNFNTLAIPVPPIEDQNAIAEHLDRKCPTISNLIEIKQNKIAKLTEYKKALIYEYVTGKKEVK